MRRHDADHTQSRVVALMRRLAGRRMDATVDAVPELAAWRDDYARRLAEIIEEGHRLAQATEEARFRQTMAA